MPKTKSRKIPKGLVKQMEIARIGSQVITRAMDKSKFELSHHKVMETKDQEVTKITRKPHLKSMASRQKKQFAMKRGQKNMRQNFRNKCLM